MATAAESLAKKAKAYRSTKGTEELANIKTAINTLQTKADARASLGASYLQLSPSADGQVFTAVQTLQGKLYLEQNGFTVEDLGNVINIWWEPRDTIEREKEAILNPPKPDPTPPATGGTTTPATGGTTTPATGGTTTPATGGTTTPTTPTTPTTTPGSST